MSSFETFICLFLNIIAKQINNFKKTIDDEDLLKLFNKQIALLDQDTFIIADFKLFMSLS